MLTKEEYRKIADNWKGTVYQKWDRYQVRFPMLLKHIDVFKGKNVLEVGCNAGIAAYHIAQSAKSYIGVEAEKGYFEQALETKKFIKNNNAEFLNMSIKSYMKRAVRDGIEISANAVYLSYVLYHFSDKEVQMFETQILPKLDVIIVQSRYAKRNKKGRRKHNSYGFWHPANVIKFLEKNGFSTTTEWGPDKKFHFIVGKKSIEKPLLTTMKKPIDMEESAPIKMGDCETLDGVHFKQKSEEKPHGDKGDSTVHTEGEGKTTEGRRTRSGKGRVVERKPRSSTGGEASPKRPRRTVRSKDGNDGDKGILQSGVEKGPEEELRNTDIQKVEKTPRNRRRTKANENSVGEGKPAV